MSKSHHLSCFIWITLPRPQAKIDANLTKAEAEILRLLSEVTAEASVQ